MKNHQSETKFTSQASQQSPMDCGDDPFSISALLNLDNYPELCSPFISYSSPYHQVPTDSSSDMDNLEIINPNFVPKPIPSNSLAERMLRVLSLFKESSGSGILAQVWMPIKYGDGFVLSTWEQPFLLDHILAGYREISRNFTFSAEETPGLLPGLPGRVFLSGLPEWTSNVGYYSKFEYLRAEHANSHQVRGSLAVPIFDFRERSCCAVLELVTTKEKANFDVEMESVCNALQAVELRTIKSRVHQQSLTMNQKSALNEILDVVRACCHAHMLPLALTWVPFSDNVELSKSASRNTMKKYFLCIQESACYINDPKIKGFLDACSEHRLEIGKGISGKALESNGPFFSPDVKSYNIREYPLAHHARKFGLNAAVAIRLRSTLTREDDYVLEFFLPVNCKGSSEQQELLNNLSITMQRICSSLRTLSDAEVLGGFDSNELEIQKQEETSSSSRHSQQMDSDNEVVSTDIPVEDQNMISVDQVDANNVQFKRGIKRSTAEKNVSLSVLQEHFSGSLKDAAKSIGVCPTTLKRICRQHGILRWPSRKIKKVNHSLEKIQTVINSVQGVDGALKYDPTTGCIISSVSTLTTPDTINNQDSNREAEIFTDSADKDEKVDNIDALKGGKRNFSSSSLTDSSSGSASSLLTSTKCSTENVLLDIVTAMITVKARYRDDIVRFKFVPKMGCGQLVREIGKRFKLSIGTFQLKYMDDEDEWVMLSNDSDLVESVEMLESIGSKNLRLLVRDVSSSFGSSCGSNFLQL